MARRELFFAMLPVALSALAVAAILSEPLPPPVGFIGEVTGDPEKDTYARDVTGLTHEGSQPTYSRTPRYVGWLTNDPEKDTFGHVVARLDEAPMPLAASR